MLAVISMSGLLPLLIHVIIIALVFWLLWWLIGYLGLPEPFNRVLRVIIALVAVLFLINLLMGLDGHAFIVP